MGLESIFLFAVSIMFFSPQWCHFPVFSFYTNLFMSLFLYSDSIQQTVSPFLVIL